MAFTTFAGLKAEIADWLNRDDLTSNIGSFVALAESQFNSRLRTSEMEANTTLTLDADSEATLPSDYLEARQVTVTSSPRRALERVSPEFHDENYPYRESGVPRTYSIIGTTMLVLPRTTSSVSLDYYQSITALSADDDANWVLTNHPGLYLYGALYHASPFLLDDERSARWGELYEMEFKLIENRDQRKRHPRPRARLSCPTP